MKVVVEVMVALETVAKVTVAKEAHHSNRCYINMYHSNHLNSYNDMTIFCIATVAMITDTIATILAT